MRTCFTGGLVLLGGAALALSTLGAESAGEAGEWLRWHFLGSSRIAGDTNGGRAQVVFEQPSTRILVERAISSLARSASLDTNSSSLVRTFLEESLRVESFGSVRGEPGTPESQWLVAARLGGERAHEWAGQWESFGRTTGQAGARSGVREDWFIGGLRPAEPADLAPLQERVTSASKTEGETAWLEIHADLDHLARRFGWPRTIAWPQVQLTLAGRGLNVRTTAELHYAAPLNLPLSDWDIPTNTVREPLLSFAALQGVQPWLTARSSLQELDWPAPNQVFCWSQSLGPYATHFAWRMPEVESRIPASRDKLMPVVCALAPWANVGEVELVAEAHRLNWRGLPILVPFVMPAYDPGFAFAGIFPIADPRGPAPPELYAQLRGRTNLVYYEWELTQPRLRNWDALDIMHLMIGLYQSPPTNSLARVWMRDTNVTDQLGNCVTELTLASPTALRAVRTSAVGLTAFELFRTALWIEGENFPRYTPPPRLELLRSRRASGSTNNKPATRR